MKKRHTYEVTYYGTGGWLNRMLVTASTKAEAIKKAHESARIIETVCVRFIN